jgi:NADPH-dependent 2,4-dienoyl-CoA reductase/sulfur reductase-like enzyme
VVDKSDRLGGTLWFSTLTTPDNERLLNWLKEEVDRLGISVQLGTEATVESIRALRPDHVVVATGAKRPKPAVPGGDLPLVQTGDTLRALMLGTAEKGDAGLVLRALGKMGRLSGITKSPAAVREMTKKFLPMGHDVVVIGGSLVGLELAEFLSDRGRKVTLLHEEQQLGLPMAMPRRWTAVKHATQGGVDIHRRVTLTRITESSVEWTEGEGEAHSAKADMVIYAEGTHSDTSLADALGAAGLSVEVVGDAGAVNYIHGAIHSAWDVATVL